MTMEGINRPRDRISPADVLKCLHIPLPNAVLIPRRTKRAPKARPNAFSTPSPRWTVNIVRVALCPSLAAEAEEYGHAVARTDGYDVDGGVLVARAVEGPLEVTKHDGEEDASFEEREVAADARARAH